MNYLSPTDYKNIGIRAVQKVFNYAINLNVSLWAKGVVFSACETVYALQNILKQAVKQLFPQTATGEFLDYWLAWEGLERLVANPSSGFVNFEGEDSSAEGEIIPEGTLIQHENGLVFSTLAEGSIAEQIINCSVSGNGATMTVTCEEEHGLGSSQKAELDLVLNGAVSATDITVLSPFVFTFSSPIAGSDTGDCTTYNARIKVQCLSEGSETNLLSGDTLELSDGISKIEDTVYMPENISSGTDDETDEDARARLFLSRKIIRGTFSIDQCILAGLSVSGNKQILHDPPTIGVEDTPKVAGFQPRSGEAVFYVIREIAGAIETPVPADVLASTKQAIIDNGKLPANTSEDDLYVFSPIVESVNFTNVSVTPDTPAMRTAFENQLASFFSDNANIGVTLKEKKLTASLVNTQDLTTGTLIEDFSFTAPSGDIIPTDPKAILILGTVTYA